MFAVVRPRGGEMPGSQDRVRRQHFVIAPAHLPGFHNQPNGDAMSAETSIASADSRCAGNQWLICRIVEHDDLHFHGLFAGVRVRGIMPAEVVAFEGGAVGLWHVERLAGICMGDQTELNSTWLFRFSLRNCGVWERAWRKRRSAAG